MIKRKNKGMIKVHGKININYIKELMKTVENERKKKFFKNSKFKVLPHAKYGECLDININLNHYILYEKNGRVYRMHENQWGNKKKKNHYHTDRNYSCWYHAIDSLATTHREKKKTHMEKLFDKIK